MKTLNLKHKKTNFSGNPILPASKSISNRLQIINALSRGLVEIQNLSNARDSQVMKSLLADTSSVKDVKDAGTVMRFLTAFYALGDKQIILQGTNRMHQRPIGVLVDALNALGANIEYLKKIGYPPLKINAFKPRIACQELEIDGSISSQYISALMMIGPYLPTGLWLKLKGEAASKPYIKMTLALMKSCGAVVEMKGDKIQIKPSKYVSKEHFVESDWSAASYWYSFLALADEGEIKLNYLNKNSIQGDRIIASIFSNLGVETTFVDDVAILKRVKADLPKTLEIDFVDCPDLAQTLAVFCAVQGIELTMKGVESLKIKETNRVEALQNELAKLNIKMIEKDNTCIVKSKRLQHFNTSTCFNTYEDHRMAMAFAPLCLLGEISFDEESVVNKSYPDFWHEISLI